MLSSGQPRAQPPGYFRQAVLVPVLCIARCESCYSYWHRTGRERPAALWERLYP